MKFKNAMAIICGVLFIMVGVFHFLRPEPFIKIVPEFIPFPAAAVYVSGVAEVLGGLGLLIRHSRKLAAFGLIALLVAVFPANINMAMKGIDFGLGFPHYLLWCRLPLQLLLIAWVGWFAKD